MIYDLCFDKYNYMNYIPKKLFICDDLNLENNFNFNFDNFDNKKNNFNNNSLFNIFHLFGMSFFQIKQLLSNGEFISQLFLHGFFQKKRVINNYYKFNEFNQRINLFINKDLFINEIDYKLFSIKGNLPPLIIHTILSRKNCINNKLIKNRCYIPKAISFPPLLICSSKRSIINQKGIKYNLLLNKILYGINFSQYNKTINLKISPITREILNSEINNN